MYADTATPNRSLLPLRNERRVRISEHPLRTIFTLDEETTVESRFSLELCGNVPRFDPRTLIYTSLLKFLDSGGEIVQDNHFTLR